jgi:hypothetical protein
MCHKHDKEENENVIETSWLVLLLDVEVVPESLLAPDTSYFY